MLEMDADPIKLRALYLEFTHFLRYLPYCYDLSHLKKVIEHVASNVGCI